MTSVTWACIVYEGDAKWLLDHLKSVFRQDARPDLLFVVDTSQSELIHAAVERAQNSVSASIHYVPLDDNLGFNAGYNKAVTLAVEQKTEWLATMTVRAKPAERWLSEAVEAGASEKVGMVTTLHLTQDRSHVDCFGHNIGPCGELFDFGQDLPLELLDELPRLPGSDLFPVWAPCSGGALYRTQALKAALRFAPDATLLRPFGFKSYNCDVIGYFLRSQGFQNICVRKAILKRDRKGSTSRRADSPGLLINQEINRIANMYEFWRPTRRDNAIRDYLGRDRTRSCLKPIDLRVARTLGQATARRLYESVGMHVERELAEIITANEQVVEVRNRYLLKHRDGMSCDSSRLKFQRRPQRDEQ